MKRFAKIYSLFAVLATVFAPGPAVHAINSYDNVPAINDTVFYDARDYNTVDCSTTDTTGTTDLTGADNIEKIYNFLLQKGLKDFQAAGVLGNFRQESGGTVDPTAVNSVGSTGIAQWEGGRLDALKAFAVAKNKPVTDLALQLDYLWKELTTTENRALSALRGSTDVTSATIAFQNAFERCSKCVQDQRIKYAKEVLKLYGAAGGITGTGTPTDNGTACSSGGVVQGDIVATAMGLAWPKPTGHNLSDPTPAYKKAWNGSSDYTDCGAFVATVMVESGADPNYPHVGTSVQIDYLTSHPAKYTIINSPNSTAQLQPGDILIFSASPFGHTMIYVGAAGKTNPIVDASLGDHTPMMNTAGDLAWMLNQPGVIAARLK